MAQRCQVDVVDVFQERVRVDLMQLDQAGERRSVVMIVALLQIAGVFERNVEQLGDEGAHAVIDLGE